MFRAALHVGFAPTGVLRLTRDQLDGACGDDRFDGDFFVDLIFEACSGSAQALEMVLRLRRKEASRRRTTPCWPRTRPSGRTSRIGRDARSSDGRRGPRGRRTLGLPRRLLLRLSL